MVKINLHKMDSSSRSLQIIQLISHPKSNLSQTSFLRGDMLERAKIDVRRQVDGAGLAEHVRVRVLLDALQRAALNVIVAWSKNPNKMNHNHHINNCFYVNINTTEEAQEIESMTKNGLRRENKANEKKSAPCLFSS